MSEPHQGSRPEGLAPPLSAGLAPVSPSPHSPSPHSIEGPPPARLRLAGSLDQLRHGMLVHVDEQGQVRSPARYRALSLLDFAVSAGAASLGTALYATFFGPFAGGLAALFLGGTVLISSQRRRRVEQVAAFIAEGRLVEAEALCRRLLSARLLPARAAAAAHHGLSVVAARRGDFGEALLEVRAALHLHRRALRRGLSLDLLAYAEIGLLVNLGRVSEARTRLSARGAVPEGDYLRVLHWSADLAVQFAEQRLAIDDDELWSRSRRALELLGMPHLLALCAWGSAARGDESLSDHLLAEAIDRATPECAATFPSLWRWVEARRPRLSPP